MGARARCGSVVQRMLQIASHVCAQHLGNHNSIAFIPARIFSLGLLVGFIGAERSQRLGGVEVVHNAALAAILIPPALTALVAFIRFGDSHDYGVEPMKLIVIGSRSKDEGG